jgi:hypothetical protein
MILAQVAHQQQGIIFGILDNQHAKQIYDFLACALWCVALGGPEGAASQ